MDNATDVDEPHLLVSHIDKVVHIFAANCGTFNDVIDRFDSIYMKPVTEAFLGRDRTHAGTRQSDEPLEEFFKVWKIWVSSAIFLLYQLLKTKKRPHVTLLPRILLPTINWIPKTWRFYLGYYFQR